MLFRLFLKPMSKTKFNYNNKIDNRAKTIRQGHPSMTPLKEVGKNKVPKRTY